MWRGRGGVGTPYHLDAAQVRPCPVGPGAWPPWVTDPSGRASEAASGRSAPGGCLPAASISPVRNGGKNTREEEFPPPWTHLLWFLKPGKAGSSFSYKLRTDARNGPPPGWAGWEAGVGIGRKRLWGPLPKAFSSGGRWPGAAGTDEGATGYPTGQKKEKPRTFILDPSILS